MSQPQKSMLSRRASNATVPQPQKMSATRRTFRRSVFAKCKRLRGDECREFRGVRVNPMELQLRSATRIPEAIIFQVVKPDPRDGVGIRECLIFANQTAQPRSSTFTALIGKLLLDSRM